jgi:hypothetical protein
VPATRRAVPLLLIQAPVISGAPSAADASPNAPPLSVHARPSLSAEA